MISNQTSCRVLLSKRTSISTPQLRVQFHVIVAVSAFVRRLLDFVKAHHCSFSDSGLHIKVFEYLSLASVLSLTAYRHSKQTVTHSLLLALRSLTPQTIFDHATSPTQCAPLIAPFVAMAAISQSTFNTQLASADDFATEKEAGPSATDTSFVRYDPTYMPADAQYVPPQTTSRDSDTLDGQSSGSGAAKDAPVDGAAPSGAAGGPQNGGGPPGGTGGPGGPPGQERVQRSKGKIALIMFALCVSCAVCQVWDHATDKSPRWPSSSLPSTSQSSRPLCPQSQNTSTVLPDTPGSVPHISLETPPRLQYGANSVTSTEESRFC